METNTGVETAEKLDRLNTQSEELIRESYLAGSCRSVWVLGLDDGMN